MRQWPSFSTSQATSSNKVSSSSNICEVQYPFGVQNDLGRVILRGQSSDDCTTNQHIVKCQKVSFPTVESPEPSNSSHTTSDDDSSVDVFELEKAIRENDVIRVRHFILEHRSKFQLRKSIKNYESHAEDENLLQEITPLLSNETEKNPTGGEKPDLYDYLPSSFSRSARSASSSSSTSSEMSASHSFNRNSPLIYRNALHLAVAHDAADVVRLLLRHNVDPESIGVLNQVDTFENDNNNSNALSTPRASACLGSISNDHSPGEIVFEESSASSRSGSNASLMNRVYCPLQIVPRTLMSRHCSRTSSPRSVQLSSERCSIEASPLKSAAAQSGGTRGYPYSHSSQKVEENDSRTKTLYSDSSIDLRTVSSPRRVSWVPPNQVCHSETHRRRRMPLKHLSRQRSFSLESHDKTTHTSMALDSSRKCVSLKSSPQISVYAPATLLNKSVLDGSPSPRQVQKQSSSATERSIMAELRRSSEIFKSILMNLSIKESDSVLEVVHSSPSSTHEDEIDVHSLWTMHKQHYVDNYHFFDNSSSSSGSSSHSTPDKSPDRSNYSAFDADDFTARNESWLKINPILPSSKFGIVGEIYTPQFLFELPPLFMAVLKGNSIMTELLLKYGSNPNYQDTYGNTPLHLAMCQTNVPWECVLDLLENGARIYLANHQGTRAIDLTSKPTLLRLSAHIIDSCWHGVLESEPQQNAVATKASTNSGRILRKLRSNTIEPTEDATSNGSDVTPDSIRSSTGPYSTEQVKKDANETKQKINDARRLCKLRKKEWRNENRQKQPTLQSGKEGEPPNYNFDRSFNTLILMSSNIECLERIIKAFVQNAGKFLNLFQTKNLEFMCTNTSTFLHRILETGVSAFPQTPIEVSDPSQLERNRKELSAILCLLAKICLHLVHSVYGAQYLAMLVLNKIIDLSVKYQLTFCKSKLSQALQHPSKVDLDDKLNESEQESPSCFSRKSSQNRLEKTFSKRPIFTSRLTESQQTKKTEEEQEEECLLDVLTGVHASSVLNTLHNALTLFKRVINCNRKCTPSKRLVSCNYHCLQVLSGRVLLFMTQNEEVQHELLQEQQLRILAATLDLTHDPQLLVLMLQIFANAALQPKNHRAMIDQGIPDLLSQLLLPSDDWYYNAHSTKYGLFVKHHVSRVLVYLGFQHRVNHKYSVFDYHAQEELKEQQQLLDQQQLQQQQCQQQPQQSQQQQQQQQQQQRHQNHQLLTQLLVQQLQQQPQTHELDKSRSNKDSETPKSEKDYISLTSICPSVVLSQNDITVGISVENSVYYSLKVIESTLSQPPMPFEQSTLPWMINGFYYNQINNAGQCPVRKLPSDPNTVLFAQNFMACFPYVLNPIIMLRLLSHRLITTAPLHRWKSSASRSSFGSVMTHDLPRSPRSRASSTETETSTLRKRRKVNLTLDCANWLNETCSIAPEEISSTSVSSNRASRTTPRPSQCRDSSISSASGLGIEPAIQALNAFSLKLRYASSRDSIRSTGSCEDGHNYLGHNVHHKAKHAFRFSSLKHHKRRSKSQANISKVDRSRTRVVVEQDILEFQRRLQNFPNFDSPDHSNGLILDPAIMLNDFLRPRSRSMPRVTYESNRYLALPDSGFSTRSPRERLIGSLGFQSDLHGTLMLGSPATTPTDDRRPSATQTGPIVAGIMTGNSNSRRSSLSPASDRNVRRRDSPACLQMEVPPRHRAILAFVEEWLKVSRIELEHNTTLVRELREFLTKVATCGAPYQQWCIDMRQDFPALNKDPDSENIEDHDDIDREYCQLVKEIITGELPCNKEEAAVLACIQLRIEESWGRPNFFTFSPAPCSSYGDEDLAVLKTISEDKESFLLEVPTFGGHTGGKVIRPVSPLAEDAENEEENDLLDSKKTIVVNPSPSLKEESSAHFKSSRNSLLRKCYPSNSNQFSFLPSGGHLEDFLPPYYLGSRCMGKLIKEQKRKLFHTPIYDSETQLKKLYIQTCRRLPAFHCRIFQVKELVRGKTKKKAVRLLGLNPQKLVLLDEKKCISKYQTSTELQQWRSGGGRSHDRLILEFRSVRWSLIIPTTQAMREIGISLWQILQDNDTNFLEQYASVKSPSPSDITRRLNGAVFQPQYTTELESLQKLLHFPEEVALSLSETENSLFYQIPPIDYLRQVTLDLGGPPSPRLGVRSLARRFNEVSSYITHLIIMQPTHEDRKAVVSCILRVAVTCWNIGNFNGSMEILAGLKSTKLKPFWLTVTERESPGVPLLDWLTNLTTARYDEALATALKIAHCPVVPFFGSFVKELQHPLAKTPSLVVLAPNIREQELQRLQETLPDLVEQDNYLTIINVAGSINLEKMYQAQSIMDHIAVFHQHFNNRIRLQNSHIPVESIHAPEIERSYTIDESKDECYRIAMDSYSPIQPVNYDHGVCSFPITSACSGLNSHILQMLHHGATAIHWDVEGSRSCLIYVRLERSCSTISWKKPHWSGLKSNPVGSIPDYNLSVRMEDVYTPGTPNKPIGEIGSIGLEEGFLELSYVKELYVGARDKEKEVELLTILKRYGLEGIQSTNVCCVTLLFGNNVSDNRSLYLLFPPKVFKIWFEGLCNVVRGLKYQLQLIDRRMIWLKEQYVQLFLDDGTFSKPLITDSIKVFGGRDWSITGTSSGISPPENGAMKRGTSMKFGKKRGSSQLMRAPNELTSKSSDAADLSATGCRGRTALGLGSQSLPPPSRSRSISSDIDTWKSPQNHGDYSNKSSLSRKIDILSQIKSISQGENTQETLLDFVDFVTLFKSFNLRCRKDIRELFDHLAVSGRSVSDSSLTDSERSSSERIHHTKQIGLLTRNSSIELEESRDDSTVQKKKIYDYIAAASILSNSAGVDTSRSQIITLQNFSNFLEKKQFERLTEAQVIELIHRHEPDPLLRSQNCLSFEGFARYLLDKENYAFPNERMRPNDSDMDRPLSQYYIASSHNTYLTGHQLRGASSVDLYTHVLLMGCRCVELDCWDGDDGNPLIYHGRTFTTKIPFKAVVEAINKAAFVASAYPVILSIENHCSIQQQSRMAAIFQNVFGDKLVTKFMFDADYSDDPHLPSPAMLKNRILIKNKKLLADITPHPILRGNRMVRQPQAPRASSIVSNTSGGSLNDEFSDDEDDDDDDEDDNLDATTRTDSVSSHETPSRMPTKSSLQLADSDWNGLEDDVNPKSKKQSTQISKDLSDIVTYIQAIKFHGPTTISPSSSVRYSYKRPVTSSISSAMNKKSAGTGSPSTSDSHHAKQRPNVTHPCYQCSSLNENAAKKLCRKQPLDIIAHTETQLVRTYPAPMRIDSSNFNPVIFWSFGIQMVALNYQTEDTALHINAAMFEQNGRCGYVPKPSVMCDRSHMMYRRFNPLDKEFDGLHSSNFILTVISGQYLSQNNFTTSVQVEIEIIGIPVDSTKQKTKVIQRNSLNPVWNDKFYFQIMFHDLTFVRFHVLDTSTGHIIAQRVIPLKHLRPGYRHVRLRNNQNQPLHLSTLFICSRTEEESLDYMASENASKEGASTSLESSSPLNRPDPNCPGLKRKMFFLKVYGVVPEEPNTILKITQESTTQEVILQALQKTGLSSERINDYVLVEEVSRGWELKDREIPATQRVLDPQECPLQAQSLWQGEGRFLLKRLGDDPSSRAWLSSIRSTRMHQPKTWEDADNFLVCVYNVSADIPYAIMKAPVSASAQDVLAQALVKARRLENPSQFVLIEELEYGAYKQQRILPDDENIYSTQAHWPTLGKFILSDREVTKKVKSTTFEKLSKGLSKLPVGEALSDPPASRLMKTRFPLSMPSRGGSAKENVVAGPDVLPKKQREVHSEGEAVSDEEKEQDFIRAVSRLKRLSIRKFRVWKS